MPNLAISLHSTTEEQRDLLVPINRKYGLEELLDACRRFPLKRRERITFEYVMLEGRQRHARGRAPAGAAAARHQGARSTCCRSTRRAGIPFERPSDERVNRFAQILADHGVTVSVRKSRGRDIRAACGQLITESSRAAAPGKRLAMMMELIDGSRRSSTCLCLVRPLITRITQIRARQPAIGVPTPNAGAHASTCRTRIAPSRSTPNCRAPMVA